MNYRLAVALLFTLALLVSAGCANNKNVRAASATMQAESFQQSGFKSLKQLTKAAKQGKAEAQYHLGLLYLDEQDDTQAFLQFTQAAEQGHAAAQFQLSKMYRLGLGVQQDNTAALAWLSKAAEQEYSEAQLNLANKYYTVRNYLEAFSWYKKTASKVMYPRNIV